jgi:hypothetical protein
MYATRIDHDESAAELVPCVSCAGEPVAASPGAAWCTECTARPEDEVTAEHYWEIGGSDDLPRGMS